ncbi:hypothetical protein CR513_62223, partial [Mucuna pruriens]
MTKQLGRIENLKQIKNISSLPSTSKPLIKPIQTNKCFAKRIRSYENKAKIRKLAVDKPFFNTIEINKLKVYPKLRNYYPRSSLVDAQYEERGGLVQNSFSGNETSKWNLDGMGEQTILYLTCQMTMTATAHKTKGCSNKSAALTIIQGFSGQLKRNPNIFKHKVANQLTNLYCPTMLDYR